MSGVQLVMPLDGADDPERGQVEAIEAAVLDQEGRRAGAASYSRPCRCSSPVVDDESCVLCGHDPLAVAA